jgi:hypothetical protein
MKVQKIHPQALQIALKQTLTFISAWYLTHVSFLPQLLDANLTNFKRFHDRAWRTMLPCEWNWWRNIAYLLSVQLQNFH